MRESNPQGCEARPGSSGVPSPLGLPFHLSQAPVAGLEPAVGQTPRRLNRPILATSSGTPDHTVRTAGFEERALVLPRPTLRVGARRIARLSYVLSIKSAQRELNPRFRLGKAAGCRYIMGAILRGLDCQRPRAPGGTRTRVAALRVRCPCHWTTSAITSVGPEGLGPSPGGSRVRCAAASTLIPSARRESNPTCSA